MTRPMVKLALVAGLAALAQAAMSGAAAAQAQTQTLAPVTFVSATANPQNTACSAFFPCQNFFTALQKTEPDGTVYVQGPYFFDSMTLERGTSIVATGNVVIGRVIATVPAGENALLEGIHFEDASDTLPASGVVMSGAGKVTIKNCTFNNFDNVAIRLAGAAGARLVIDGAIIKGSATGLFVSGANGASNAAIVRDTLIDGSFQNAIRVDGAANTVVIMGSTLSGSGQSDLSLVNGGRAISYGDNVIRSGAPSQSLPTN